MKRTYELCFIVEPQRTDDESKAICEKYKKVVADSGATIDHVWEWGKRKLAYPVQNFKEGIYWVLYVTLDGSKAPWPDVERLMTQDEHVLRYLVVRTDEDLERGKRGKVQPTQPWETAAESR